MTSLRAFFRRLEKRKIYEIYHRSARFLLSGVCSGFKTRSCGNGYRLLQRHRDGCVLLPSLSPSLGIWSQHSCQGKHCFSRFGHLHQPHTVRCQPQCRTGSQRNRSHAEDGRRVCNARNCSRILPYVRQLWPGRGNAERRARRVCRFGYRHRHLLTDRAQ